jgi:hypothetical protein
VKQTVVQETQYIGCERRIKQMMHIPNYALSTKDDLKVVISYEAFLVQCIEVLERAGEHDESLCIRTEKKLVSIRRKCMKAALTQKEKAASRVKITA